MDKYAKLMQRLDIINIEFLKVCEIIIIIIIILFLVSLSQTLSKPVISYRVYASFLEYFFILFLKALVSRTPTPVVKD